MIYFKEIGQSFSIFSNFIWYYCIFLLQENIACPTQPNFPPQR